MTWPRPHAENGRAHAGEGAWLVLELRGMGSGLCAGAELPQGGVSQRLSGLKAPARGRAAAAEAARRASAAGSAQARAEGGPKQLKRRRRRRQQLGQRGGS